MIMSKQAEAELILKLYELRREETMRKARDWFVRGFNPQSVADIKEVMFSEHSGYLRMVLTYWDMAAHSSIMVQSVPIFSLTPMVSTSACLPKSSHSWKECARNSDRKCWLGSKN